MYFTLEIILKEYHFNILLYYFKLYYFINVDTFKILYTNKQIKVLYLNYKYLCIIFFFFGSF